MVPPRRENLDYVHHIVYCNKMGWDTRICPSNQDDTVNITRGEYPQIDLCTCHKYSIQVDTVKKNKYNATTDPQTLQVFYTILFNPIYFNLWACIPSELFRWEGINFINQKLDENLLFWVFYLPVSRSDFSRFCTLQYLRIVLKVPAIKYKVISLISKEVTKSY